MRNAVTHAPEGESVALEIGARDGSLVVSVRGGVSRGWPDPVERAFEPLVSEASERLGLGLAAVRLVAEQHGGSVELRAGRPETDAPTHVRLVIPAPP
ncbi:MAG: ATP-binding protein [Sandaracinaceae bacterium]|nr:ATP-binding protein [Sandaracinaceae bacterium]